MRRVYVCVWRERIVEQHVRRHSSLPPHMLLPGRLRSSSVPANLPLLLPPPSPSPPHLLSERCSKSRTITMDHDDKAQRVCDDCVNGLCNKVEQQMMLVQKAVRHVELSSCACTLCVRCVYAVLSPRSLAPPPRLTYPFAPLPHPLTHSLTHPYHPRLPTHPLAPLPHPHPPDVVDDRSPAVERNVVDESEGLRSDGR
jgi:hypothetical protein